MPSSTIGILAFTCIFGCALLGIWLRSRLPEHHLRDRSLDAIKVAAGTVATMSALVLGLLVGSAKSSFDTTSNAITQAATKCILLDRTLARYGPETAELRQRLHQSVELGIEIFWPTEPAPLDAMRVFEHQSGMEAIAQGVEQLQPSTDAQRHLVGQALQTCNDLMQARWQLIESSQNDLPWPLLAALILWMSTFFLSIGLAAPFNRTVVLSLLVATASVAAAIYLISEMNQSLTGTIHVSGAPMRKALELIGQ